ncbi:sec1 [Symbiodinium sp. CCMP2592]|nr:sec1 [Symbiodinium sp. CCMP2592]
MSECDTSRDDLQKEVDGYLVRPLPIPILARKIGRTALSVIGGELPVTVQELAKRAYLYTLDPLRNPVKEVYDASSSVLEMPPMLGIFNDIPTHKMREDEVAAWARAGFSFIVSDAEHRQISGWQGREENAMIARAGMLPVQRLHREAVSQHGDALQLGARATMRPYATKLFEAEQYFDSITFPPGRPGTASKDSRGGYPTRLGDRTLCFTPNSLRASESETQGWLQFETSEYILNAEIRDSVLDLMCRQGPGRAVGFVGPFDAVMRDGIHPSMSSGMNQLFQEAARRGVVMGRVCGSGVISDPSDIEDAIVEAIQQGSRLISVHRFTSDLPFFGARAVAEPFWRGTGEQEGRAEAWVAVCGEEIGKGALRTLVDLVKLSLSRTASSSATWYLSEFTDIDCLGHRQMDFAAARKSSALGVCHIDDLLKERIALVESLDAPREALPLDAVYFLAPSLENMDRLVEELSTKSAKYRSSHIFFSHRLEDLMLQRLAESLEAVSKISTFSELNLSMLAYDDHSFHMQDHGDSLKGLLGIASQEAFDWKRAGCCLATLFATLGQEPRVLCATPGGNEGHCERLAREVCIRLEEMEARGGAPWRSRASSETCSLLIVDRAAGCCLL